MAYTRALPISCSQVQLVILLEVFLVSLLVSVLPRFFYLGHSSCLIALPNQAFSWFPSLRPSHTLPPFSHGCFARSFSVCTCRLSANPTRFLPSSRQVVSILNNPSRPLLMRKRQRISSIPCRHTFCLFFQTSKMAELILDPSSSFFFHSWHPPMIQAFSWHS